MKTNVKSIMIQSSVLCMIALPGIINAHDMWFEMLQYKIDKGAFLECRFPSDHVFPSTQKEFIPADRMAATYLIPPSGQIIPLNAMGNNMYRSARRLLQEGTYLGVSGKKWTYWVKTTEGYIEGKNKTQVTGALRGIYSAKFAKAIVVVQHSGGTIFMKPAGHEIEIIPLRDPYTISKGDTLPIKVLLKGKPTKIEVNATYEGYSTKQNAFATTVTTDELGRADIRITKHGTWLIQTSAKEIPADTRLYDEKIYSATLTFQILKGGL